MAAGKEITPSLPSEETPFTVLGSFHFFITKKGSKHKYAIRHRTHYLFLPLQINERHCT